MFINVDSKAFYDDKIQMDKAHFIEFIRSFSWYVPEMDNPVSDFFDNVASQGHVEMGISASLYTGKPPLQERFKRQ
jgi:hypothetical protein